MKRLITLALLAASISAHAAQPDQPALCENLADFTGMVTLQRDRGMTLLEMKRQITIAHLRSDVAELFNVTAERVYLNADYSNLNTNQARAYAYRSCMSWDLSSK